MIRRPYATPNLPFGWHQGVGAVTTVEVRQQIAYFADDWNHTVHRALDGQSAAEQIATFEQHCWDLAVDADHLYVSDEKAGTIWRILLSDTDSQEPFVEDALAPRGMLLDGGSLYWAEAGVLNGMGVEPTTGSIRRHRNGVTTILATDVDRPMYLVDDSEAIYYTDGLRVMKVAK
jgi:hypothetical protein